MDVRSGYAPVPGGRLYLERAGEGFPVVLAHPGPWDLRIWDLQFETFAAHHDVIRYDLRGHGRSDAPSGPYSDVRDLREVLAYLGVARCAIVGCSAGSRVAVELALEAPELVDAVVLASPILSGYPWNSVGAATLEAEVRRAVGAGDRLGAMEMLLAVWAPLSSGPSVDAFVRRVATDNLRVLPSPDGSGERPEPAATRLREVQAATLVIVGDDDVAEIHEVADLIVERVPGAHKREVHGADHLVMVRQPEVFNRLVLDFLAFRT